MTKNELRRLETEEGNKVINVCDEKEIEGRFKTNDKHHFSKVKISKAHDDKTCDNVNYDATRDKIFKEDLIRDYWDNEEVHQFLVLSKRRDGLMAKMQMTCRKVNGEKFSAEKKSIRVCVQYLL